MNRVAVRHEQRFKAKNTMKRLFALLIVGVISASVARAAAVNIKVNMTTGPGDEATTTFAPNTAKIYAMFKTKGISRGDKVRGVLVADDVGDAAPAHTKVLEHTLTLEEDTNDGDFNFSKPNKGWPTGKYHVEIYVNDELAMAPKFTIKGGAKPKRANEDEHLDQKEAELNRRAAELDQREGELKEKATSVPTPTVVPTTSGVEESRRPAASPSNETKNAKTGGPSDDVISKKCELFQFVPTSITRGESLVSSGGMCPAGTLIFPIKVVGGRDQRILYFFQDEFGDWRVWDKNQPFASGRPMIW